MRLEITNNMLTGSLYRFALNRYADDRIAVRAFLLLDVTEDSATFNVEAIRLYAERRVLQGISWSASQAHDYALEEARRQLRVLRFELWSEFQRDLANRRVARMDRKQTAREMACA